MARIAGINIPDDKRVEIALTYVYGIGRSTSSKVIRESGIDPSTRVKDLNPQSLEKLRNIIEKTSKVEGELRMSVSQNIKRLKEIGTYRGTRHIKNLPARGQRTKTNARTKRGKRVCVGSGRRAAAEKT